MTDFSIPLRPDLAQAVLASAEVKEAGNDLGEEITRTARGLTPVDTRDLVRWVEGDSDGHPDALGYVAGGGDGVDYFVYLEFATIDTPTFAPLRRAAEGAAQ